MAHKRPETTYELDFPGLQEAIAGCAPTRDHRRLLDVFRRVAPELSDAKVTASLFETYLARRQVRRGDGSWVADDHEVWLATQLAIDGGDAGATYDRLKAQDLFLTQCDLTPLFLAVDSGVADSARFIQLEIQLEREVLYQRLFDQHCWRRPVDHDDLLQLSGDMLSKDNQSLVRPAQYRWRRAINVAVWLAEADRLEADRRGKVRAHRYKVTEQNGQEEKVTIQTQDQLFPGWDSFPAPHRRLFDDWDRSSAGQAARLREHWFLDLTDYTSPDGERTMSLIPQWTFRQKIAEVKSGKGSDYEFYGTLEKLDRRVGVPFAWYFFMLHGNRVNSDAGERVIAAAEAGRIVLPEHDYRVLKDWQQKPYSF